MGQDGPATAFTSRETPGGSTPGSYTSRRAVSVHVSICGLYVKVPFISATPCGPRYCNRKQLAHHVSHLTYTVFRISTRGLDSGVNQDVALVDVPRLRALTLELVKLWVQGLTKAPRPIRLSIDESLEFEFQTIDTFSEAWQRPIFLITGGVEG